MPWPAPASSALATSSASGEDERSEPEHEESRRRGVLLGEARKQSAGGGTAESLREPSEERGRGGSARHTDEGPCNTRECRARTRGAVIDARQSYMQAACTPLAWRTSCVAAYIAARRGKGALVTGESGCAGHFGQSVVDLSPRNLFAVKCSA